MLLLSFPAQLDALARMFSFSVVTSERAPNLKAFKMSHIPLTYQRKGALSAVFAQWNPNIALSGDTAIITIADPSAGERAICSIIW